MGEPRLVPPRLPYDARRLEAARARGRQLRRRRAGRIAVVAALLTLTASLARPAGGPHELQVATTPDPSPVLVEGTAVPPPARTSPSAPRVTSTARPSSSPPTAPPTGPPTGPPVAPSPAVSRTAPALPAALPADGPDLLVTSTVDGQPLVHTARTSSVREVPVPLNGARPGERQPDWGPGRSVVVVTPRSPSGGTLRVIGSDGSPVRDLPPCPTGCVFVWPRWSPDGSHIAFHGEVTGGDGTCPPGVCGVWVVRADGSGLRQVVTSGRFPSWTADGRLLFADPLDVDDEGNEALVTVGADGSDRRPVGHRTSGGAELSPDGGVLAGAETIDGVQRVVLTRLGDGSRTVIGTGGSTSQPAWAPDGQSLLVLDGGFGEFHVYLYTRRGGLVRQVTAGSSEAVPRWRRH